MNTKADFNSRSFNVRTEWSLHPTVFSWLIQTLFTPDIGLFASRLNAKLQKFVSWMPDPCAYACDAFSLNWSEFESYAFPPFSLISRVLTRVRRDKVPRLMLIAPVWPTQSWYPILLEMLIDRPILLPKWPNLLKQPHNDQLHPLRLQLQLAAWIISGGSLVSKGISSGSTDVICHSWSCGTTKQYEPAWNAWRSWCDSRSVDLLQAPITVFVDFLHHIYAKGKCYSTVNTYRSAVSVTIETITGRSIGANSLVSRFMKGVFMEKTPQPKYCVTWDVRVVTDYIKSHITIFIVIFEGTYVKTRCIDCSGYCSKMSVTLQS